jgi:sigma-B regulation protein RsbU (phosphoserine phosphatase)
MAKRLFELQTTPAEGRHEGAEAAIVAAAADPGRSDTSALSLALGGQAEVLAVLYEIGNELTSILDLSDLLQAIGERVKRLVDYDLFSVMLVNAETQRLEHAVSLRYDERIYLRTTLALGEGLCGTAALEGKVVRVNCVACDPRYVRCESGLAVNSELVVPLIFRDRVLGVLDLESLQPGAFSEQDEVILTLLASTVAIALENARLYDQLRQAEQRRTEDLERARLVQQVLLPKAMPQIPGLDVAALYLPAQELGGDFYDFLPSGDGRLAVAVGDVAGKGSAAALLGSLGIGILREHAVHHLSEPAQLLGDLNSHLQVAGENSRFIAMVFGVFDPGTRVLTLANAGFPQPLLVRRNHVTPLEVTGVPLGLFSDTAYQPLSVRLEPGDAIVFCSDGVHEQTNDSDEEFGLQQLMEKLAETSESDCAAFIAANIVRAVEQHAGGAAACLDCRDDRTIVVLRVQEEESSGCAI